MTSGASSRAGAPTFTVGVATTTFARAVTGEFSSGSGEILPHPAQ
jgi:hypothetical protein